MLFNQDWDQKKPTISLDDFIGWLETKNPNETFDYLNKCGNCCIGQYMAARGIKWPTKTPTSWFTPYINTTSQIFGIRVEGVLSGGPIYFNRIQTFGDVLKRARAFKAKQKQMEKLMEKLNA